MDWPIESEDFEDLTFDYTPRSSASMRRARRRSRRSSAFGRSTNDQPWGIFFVKFEPKRLPVVALRRILERVVVKKACFGQQRRAGGLGDRRPALRLQLR